MAKKKKDTQTIESILASQPPFMVGWGNIVVALVIIAGVSIIAMIPYDRVTHARLHSATSSPLASVSYLLLMEANDAKHVSKKITLRVTGNSSVYEGNVRLIRCDQTQPGLCEISVDLRTDLTGMLSSDQTDVHVITGKTTLFELVAKKTESVVMDY